MCVGLKETAKEACAAFNKVILAYERKKAPHGHYSQLHSDLKRLSLPKTLSRNNYIEMQILTYNEWDDLKQT